MAGIYTHNEINGISSFTLALAVFGFAWIKERKLIGRWAFSYLTISIYRRDIYIDCIRSCLVTGPVKPNYTPILNS